MKKLLVLIAAIGCTSQVTPQAGQTNQSPAGFGKVDLTIEYQVSGGIGNVLWDRLNLSSSTGLARFATRGNPEAPYVTEIGTYEYRPSERVHADLEKLITSAKMEDVPDERGRILPGRAVRQFAFTISGKRIDKLFALTSPLPSALSAVQARLDAVIAESRSSPLQVLTISARGPQTDVPAGSPFDVLVTFINKGKEPLSFVNPKTLPGDVISFEGIVVDDKFDEIQRLEPQSIDVSTADPFVTLAAGARWEHRAQVRLGLAGTGPHTLRVLYSSYVEPETAARPMIGSVIAPPITVRLVPGR